MILNNLTPYFSDCMLIIVSGFAGSGKSTLADSIGKNFGLKVVHASHLLQQLKQKEMNELDTTKTKAGSGWWEGKEAQDYMKQRQKDSSMDKALDKELLEIAEKGDVVLDSWTMPWLCKKGIKIWLNAKAETREKRVSERDNLKYQDVLKKIKERDKKTAGIYKKIYGFEMGKDYSPFDLVIITDKLQQEDVRKIAIKKIMELEGSK